MWYQGGYISRNFSTKRVGRSVRFVRDTSTASTENNQSNTITIYPNPTTSILTIKGSTEYNIKVYDIAGRTVMTHTGNTIDMSNLSPATYIIKAVDNSNNEEFTYRVIKE
jgi:flagellar hook assembly protein FlgD